jgi:hypothetical protein
MEKPIQELTEQRKNNCERMILRQFSGQTKQEMDVIRDYFYYGDINKYLAMSSHITDMIVFEATPYINLDDYLDNIKIYWEWVIEAPHKRGNKANLERPVENRLLGKIEYYSLLSSCLTNKLKRELFFWCFGDTYDKERILPMHLGADSWQPKIHQNIDWVCFQLMNCIRNYLMGYDGEDKANENGQYYIDYFISLYPYMTVKCFALKRCTDRFYEESGEQINLQGFQLTNRWFIAGLHNILTMYEEEEEIHQLVIHDGAALKYIKEEIGKLKMPAEFYTLEKFVIKHGKDCLYATE